MQLTAAFVVNGIAAGLIALAFVAPGSAAAGSASVAVASNFTATAEDLAAAFKTATGNDLVLSFGASGALYAQMIQGAPFEILLAADTKRPKLAVDEGFGVPGSAFTYAIGKLALYSASADVSGGADFLKAGAFDKVAIADPETAPYGAAAVEMLEKLGLTDEVKDKLVTGENISQTLQFVESGSAEIGFVALSQVSAAAPEHVFVVPEDLYKPIIQDAVLLKTGESNPVAAAFVDFLKGDAAKAIITKAGYGVAQ